MSDIRVLFLYTIEESALLAFLGLALLGIRPGWKKILLIGVLQGIVIFFIRKIYFLLNFEYGSHMFFTLISLMVIIRYVTRIDWGIASAASLLSFILAMLSEATVYPFLLNYFNLTFENLQGSNLNIFLGYLAISPLLFLSIVVGITRFSLIDLDSNIGESK